MRRYVAARLFQSLAVIFFVTTVSFFLIRLAPGDPFAYEGRNISADVRDHWRAQFGYDRPLPEQYVRYLTSIAHGQLGYSQSYQQPVTAVIGAALPRTVLLVGVALGLSFTLGIALGVFQAVREGTRAGRATGVALLLFYSVPDFWLALILLSAFAYLLPIFPAGGMVDAVLYDYMGFWQRVGDRARHLVLPALTLTLLTAAAIARYQRFAMLDVLPLDFVRTARAKGASERAVILRHALRNALLPVITLLGLLLPALAGGALFVEKVFSWPGMGLMTVDAVGSRDYDLVTGSVIIGGMMVAVGSAVADLLYALVDPRLRAR